MKLNKGRMAVLAAVAIIGLLAIPIFAACPAGSIDLSDPGNYGAGEPIATPGADGGAATIQQAGSYCVPATGIKLGKSTDAGVTVVVGGSGVGGWKIAANDVTIFGESTMATVTNLASGTPAFQIDVGNNTGVVIRGFTMTRGARGTGAITTASTTIHNMTFTDSGGAWTTAVIRITGGTGTHVVNNTFNMNISNSGVPAVLITGGNGHQIDNNTINGANAGVAGQDGVQVTAVTPSGVSIQHNSFLNMGNDGIDATIGLTNSTIAYNTCTNPQANGFALGTATNVKVMNNTITGVNQTAGPNSAIVDAGGSNNTYSGNTIIAAGNAGTGPGINVASSNTTVASNTITWNQIGAGADAINIGGTSFIVKDNQILAATGGCGIDIAGVTNGTVQGNTIQSVVGRAPNNAGIWDTGGNNTIRGNTVSGLSNSGAVGAVCHGIRVGAGNDKIQNNVVQNVTSTNGGHGISVGAVTNVQVTGNTVDGVTGGGDGVNIAAGTTNLTISNNKIENISAGRGIALMFNALTKKSVNNAQLDGNTISMVYQDGILNNGGDNDTFDNNTIANAATGATSTNQWSAIRFVGGSQNNTIDGNTIKDTGSSAFAVGINITGAADNTNTVTNNEITQANSASISQGIVVLNGDNNKVDSNYIHNTGNLKDGIVIVTVGLVEVKQNKIEGLTGRGLVLAGGSTSKPTDVQGNILTNNVTGISLESGVANITNANQVAGGSTAVHVTNGTSAAAFKVNGNCFDSPVLVNNDGFGTLDATGNFWATTPGPTNVFGAVDTGNPLSSCPVAPKHCCTYPTGWNLISMPVMPASTAIPADLQPYVNTDPSKNLFWHYNPSTGNYEIPTSISGSYGYWLHVSGTSEHICVQGNVPTTDQTIVLITKGWHQIGTYIAGAYWLNTKVKHNGLTKSLTEAAKAGWIAPIAFGWSPQMGKYFSASAMQVCQGYWIKTYENNITLMIPYNQPPPTPAPPTASVDELSSDLLPPPPISIVPGGAMGGLVFTNEPNPVTDVHTTTFMVKGTLAPSVEAIKVEIFDLSGRLVYSSGAVANTSFDWHTENNYGECLANGVYLYKMYAKVNGEWVVSEVKKLVIFR